MPLDCLCFRLLHHHRKKHFTIQTHFVTKYGAHVYTKREERKGKIDMNITVGGWIFQLSFVSCFQSAKASKYISQDYLKYQNVMTVKEKHT